MKSLWFVLFLNIAQNLAAPSQEMVPRIVRGEDCDVKDHPFFVSIITRMLCGGSLVKLDFVLTAAQCAEIETLSGGKSMVRAGYTNGSNLTQTRRIDQAYIHENYVSELQDDASELRYDIALIRLKEPFDLSEVVQLVKLPTKNMEIKCKKILALGIGKTNDSEEWPQSSEDDFSRNLKCVELTISTSYKYFGFHCFDSISAGAGSFQDGSVICTWEERKDWEEGNPNWDKGKNTCVGDTGGPALCDDIQVGIISYGTADCGELEQARIYTRVDQYLDWINDTLKRALKPKKKESFVQQKNKRLKIPSRAYTKELSICITLLGIVVHIIL